MMGLYSKYISTAYINRRYLVLYNHELPTTKQGYPYCMLVKCISCKRIIMNEIAIVLHRNTGIGKSKHRCINCFVRLYGKKYAYQLLLNEANKRNQIKYKNRYYNLIAMLERS
jgi:hypothetical protein